MNVIFIYGPPASGKLTIANELSKRTGYSVFHNHMTRDIVESIYPGKVMEHYDLVNSLRDQIFSYCTQNDTDIIFTYVYDGPEDDAAVHRKVEAVTASGGKVLFVEAQASNEALLSRVSSESRKTHKKLVDPVVLAGLLREKSYSSVPYEDIYRVDTTERDPTDVADAIAAHYKLI